MAQLRLDASAVGPIRIAWTKASSGRNLTALEFNGPMVIGGQKIKKTVKNVSRQ